MTGLEIAGAPGRIPLIGHAIEVLRDPFAFLNSLSTHGDLVSIKPGPFTAVVVCDPKLLREVLLNDRVFDKGGPIFDRTREAIGHGLLASAHQGHRRQRRLIQPAFAATRLRGYSETMSEQIARRVGSWHAGQTIDVLAETFAITTSISSALLFTDTLPPSEHRQLIEDFAVVNQNITKRVIVSGWLNSIPTAGNRRYDRTRLRLRRTIRQIIVTRRSSDTDYGDLLSMIVAAGEGVAATAGNERGLSEDESIDEIISIFIAAVETTGLTLAWALYLVSQNTGVRERLQAEVDTTVTDGIARTEDLEKLKVANRVILETLRLYPPAWFFTRICTTPTTLRGCPIPAGSVIACSPYLIHHRADLHPHPETFDPDRWESGTSDLAPSSSFSPSGRVPGNASVTPSASPKPPSPSPPSRPAGTQT